MSAWLVACMRKNNHSDKLGSFDFDIKEKL